MTRQAMDMLDTAILVIFLAICIGTGWKAVFEANHRALFYNEINLEDKNTSKKNGYDVKEYGDYDGAISQMEVVLMTQIQDYNMPYPRTVKINGTETPVIAAYKSYLNTYGESAWNSVKGDDASSRYYIYYRYGATDGGVMEDQWFEIARYEKEGESHE